MKLPLNLVLGLSSAALLAQASVWFAHASPKLAAEPPDLFYNRGRAEAQALLAKSTVPTGTKWVYAPSQAWWERFRNVNLVGAQPIQPTVPKRDDDKPTPPTVRPLNEIIDMVSLAYDGPSSGKGGESHVVIRYKADSGVKPPPEVLRELRYPLVSGRPGDITASQPVRPTGAKPTTAPRPPLPTAIEYVQLLRVGQRLWPDFADVMLVEVSAEADQAWFVRIGTDGQPGTERMRLFKSNTHLSQQMQEMLDDMRRKNIVMGTAITETAPPETSTWMDVAETTRIGDSFHIGRNDAKAFGDEERFLEQVWIDPYRSKNSSLRGVQVRRVDPQLGARYGIRSGDVLLSINDEPVHNQAQLITALRKQYQLGTRTFRTKWLTSTGEEVERIYQAPPGKNDR